MPLIPYVDLDKASAEVRDAFGRFAKTMNVFRMMAHAEGCFLPWMRLSAATYQKMLLDPKSRELVILLVSRTQNGEYEWRQHEALAPRLGVSAAQIEAVQALDLENAAFSAKEQTLLRFARQVIEKVRADEDAVREMAELFTPREIVETILTVGQYMLAVRLTETTRVDIDPPADDEAVKKALKLG